jgi:hypothetical protein
VTEVISVQINNTANKRYGSSSSYNHNYNTNYKNPKYGVNNNYYYNNSNYTNTANSKYFYNGVKKESYQYYENKSFPQDNDGGKEKDVSNYRNKSLKENKWGKKYYNDRNYNKYPVVKHEFVEINDTIRQSSETTQVNELKENKHEEPKENHGSGSSKGGYVQIDVEKMFSNESLGEENEGGNSDKAREEVPPILVENTKNENNKNNNNNKIEKQDDQINASEEQQGLERNEDFPSEHSSEVDELEDVEDLNDENDEEENILEPEEEDEESEDQELIEAEFDKFIRESNMISGNKNFNEDYYNRESDTKNNKVIFEDEVKNADAETPVKKETNIIKKQEMTTENADNAENGENAENLENENKLKEATRNYIDSLKSIDPKVILEIRDKLNEDGKKTDKPNEEKNEDTVSTINNITSLQANSPSTEDFFNQRQYNKVPIHNYIFSNYAHFFYRGRDSNIHREYFALKCLEGENSSLVMKNIESFESKILIPIYQRINFNVNKKRGIYFYTFTKYKKLIYRILTKDKILKKVKPYGSYMNNFLIDSGDIDICIVPKCGILEFSQFLEKIKEEIVGGVKFFLIFLELWRA